MFTRCRRFVLLLTALAIVVGGTAAGAASAGATSPYCGITWGSLPRAGGTLNPAELATTRTGEATCYDRLVFEFAGPANGYRVAYTNLVFTEGQGRPLSVAGGAVLGVHLLEPAVAYPHAPGDHVANVAGFRTLRDVVYGGTFEGYSTFGAGVRARLPFRVFVLAGPGSHSRIVVDVANRWAA
jgi:hypothetical protein